MYEPVEHHTVVNLEYLVTEFLAHTLVNNHVAGQFGGFLQIVPGARGHAVVAISDLFGDAATEHTGQYILKFDNAVVALVFGWNCPRYTASPAARNNRYLMDWVAIRQYVAN